MGRISSRIRKTCVVLAVGSVGALAVSANAAVLLNDTWADGSRAENNLPTESATWVGVSATVPASTVVVTPTGAVPVRSKKFVSVSKNAGASTANGTSTVANSFWRNACRSLMYTLMFVTALRSMSMGWD